MPQVGGINPGKAGPGCPWSSSGAENPACISAGRIFRAWMEPPRISPNPHDHFTTTTRSARIAVKCSSHVMSCLTTALLNDREILGSTVVLNWELAVYIVSRTAKFIVKTTQLSTHYNEPMMYLSERWFPVFAIYMYFIILLLYYFYLLYPGVRSCILLSFYLIWS